MSKISEWSTTAGLNNASPPDGWPEGMARSAVNDAAREMMSSIAKWYQDMNGSLVTAGTTTAYTLATNNVHAALDEIPLLVFRVHAANTGAATLTVDSLTAKSLVRYNGAGLLSGDLTIDQLVCAAYNPDQDRFEIFGMLPATATTSGAVELATQAEAQARTDATRAVTPASLADFVRIKTGTYTGDGTTSQAITGVGFQPKYLMITRQAGDDSSITVVETTDVIVDDDAEGAALLHEDGFHFIASNRIIALGPDGFTVDDADDNDSPNASGQVYNYLALG